MLNCNHCGTGIPDGARFCPACGDPVTAGDLVRNQAAARSESVQLVCPRCERVALTQIPPHGVAQVTCIACSGGFDTRVVRIRSKRSRGNKRMDTRSFSVRVESLDGRESLIEFDRPRNEDFELRSKDLAAFTSVDGRLTLIQNMSVGQMMMLPPPILDARTPSPAPQVQSGCAGAMLLWLGALAAAGALAM